MKPFKEVQVCVALSQDAKIGHKFTLARVEESPTVLEEPGILAEGARDRPGLRCMQHWRPQPFRGRGRRGRGRRGLHVHAVILVSVCEKIILVRKRRASPALCNCNRHLARRGRRGRFEAVSLFGLSAQNLPFGGAQSRPFQLECGLLLHVGSLGLEVVTGVPLVGLSELAKQVQQVFHG